MYDPLDPSTWIPTPWNQPEPNPLEPRYRAKPITPDEEEGVLPRVGQMALGGLGYAGSVLEKTFGGRAIRGLLAGKPRELLSVLPLSDTLGITNEEDRVSGRDLLNQWGVTRPGDTGWGATLGGMGLELALDPSMYLGGLGAASGALTRGGKIAEKLAVLPKGARARVGGTLGQVLAATPAVRPEAEALAGGAAKLTALESQPLAGLASVGLPLTPWQTPVLTGQAGVSALDALGAVGGGINKLGSSLPFGVGTAWQKAGRGLDLGRRVGAAIFQPEVMGAVSEQGQKAARMATEAAAPMTAAGRAQAGEWLKALTEGGAEQTGRVLRAAGETGQPVAGLAAPTAAEQAVGTQMANIYKQYAAEADRLGIPLPVFQSQHGAYLSRQRLGQPGLDMAARGGPRKAMGVMDPRLAGREEIFDVPGLSDAINRMAADPAVHAGNNLQAAAHIQANYLGGGQVSRQAEQLADHFRSLPDAYKPSAINPNPIPYFGTHPVGDFMTYNERSGRMFGAAQASHNLLGEAAVDLRLPRTTPLVGAQVPVRDALKDVGLTGIQAEDRLLEALRAAKGNPGISANDLNHMVVPEATVKELNRFWKGFSMPESLEPVMKAFDYVTNLTKIGQTSLFPAFHTRNLLSGMWQNFVKNGFEPGRDPITGFLKPVMDANRLIRGETIQDANQIAGLTGMSAQEATAALGREMFAHGIPAHGPHLGSDIVGPGGVMLKKAPTLAELAAQIPGQQAQTFTGALGRVTQGTLNPLSIHSGPAEAGRAVGDIVEGLNRGSLYIALRRQGFNAEAAAKEVLNAHFNYARSGLSDVEHGVLRRLFPYYRYARANIPFQLEQLLTRPGGPAAMEARLASQGQERGEFLPEHLGSSLAIPLGQEDSGLRRYLTSLGLPPDQAFEMLKPGTGPGRTTNSLMALAAQSNPILKAIGERTTGKQFFTGRELADMPSTTGNTTLDVLLANSPLSRFATTGHTLMNPRQWQDPYTLPLNLLTGAKLTDVDLDQARTIAEREWAASQLRGQPAVGKLEKFYARPGMAEYLGPDQELALRINALLEQQARQAAAQKKVRVGG